jgi:Sec-independent protein translocase protein TatA
MVALLPDSPCFAQIIGSGEMVVLFLLVLIFFGPDLRPGTFDGLHKISRAFKRGAADTGGESKRSRGKPRRMPDENPGDRGHHPARWRGIAALGLGVVGLLRALEELSPGMTPGILSPNRPVAPVEPFVTLALALATLYLGSLWCLRGPKE